MYKTDASAIIRMEKIYKNCTCIYNFNNYYKEVKTYKKRNIFLYKLENNTKYYLNCVNLQIKSKY